MTGTTADEALRSRGACWFFRTGEPAGARDAAIAVTTHHRCASKRGKGARMCLRLRRLITGRLSPYDIRPRALNPGPGSDSETRRGRKLAKRCSQVWCARSWPSLRSD
jgi:hypothetical protein